MNVNTTEGGTTVHYPNRITLLSALLIGCMPDVTITDSVSADGGAGDHDQSDLSEGGAGDAGVGSREQDGGSEGGSVEGDRDQDGLSDQQELEGWTLFVDTEAFGPDAEDDKLTKRTVTSDPGNPDTDGDGISDGDEFFDRTDPRSDDTDGDRISDSEEKFRYGTNAKSVDSDGDARGPDADQFPRTSLYDGAELSAGTSPSLRDTDGDGKDDYEETIVDESRDPRIAELPQALVTFAGEIDMRLFVEYEDTEGTSTEYGSTFAQESSTSTSRSDTTSTTTTVAGEGAFFDDLEFSPEGAISFVGKKVLNLGVTFLPDEVAETLDINKQPTPDVATTESTTLTEESSLTSREEHSRYVTDSLTRSETAARGQISVGVRVTNRGASAFELDNLFITMMQWQRSGGFKTLASLTPVIEQPIALGVGRSVVLQTSAENVNPALLEEFMANPGALFYDPAQYAIRNADGVDFTFITEHAYKRTALVSIDFGNGEVQHHRVATNVERHAEEAPNPDDPQSPFEIGDPVGMRMGELLDLVGVDYETAVRTLSGDRAVQVLTRVGDVANRGAADASPFPESRSAGVVQKPTGFWVVYTERDSQAAPDLDFSDLLLRSGDQVRLVYVQDQDGDGLFARAEYALGSQDWDPLSDAALDELRPVRATPGDTGATIGYADYPVAIASGVVLMEAGADGVFDTLDSDRDGLSDFEEARTGWTVQLAGETAYQVTSSVSAIDSDGDSLTDYQERQLGTDPHRIDTDGDGVSDGCEAHPLDKLSRPRARTGWAPIGDAAESICRLSVHFYRPHPPTDAGVPDDRKPLEIFDGLLTNDASRADGDFSLTDVAGVLDEFTIDLAANATGDFIYSMGTERITAYRVNRDTGALIENAMQLAPGPTYRSIVAHPNHPLLFAALGDRVDIFLINDDSTSMDQGALTQATSYASHQFMRSVVPAPGEDFVYTSGQDSGADPEVVAARLNPQTGELTEIGRVSDGVTVPYLPQLVAAARQNTHLLIAVSELGLNVWEQTGTLQDPVWEEYSHDGWAGKPDECCEVAVHPSGDLFYVAGGEDVTSPRVRGFRLVASDAQRQLQEVTVGPTLTGRAVHFEPSGLFLFGEGSGQMYHVDPSTGGLTPVTGNTYPGYARTMLMLPR